MSSYCNRCWYRNGCEIRGEGPCEEYEPGPDFPEWIGDVIYVVPKLGMIKTRGLFGGGFIRQSLSF